MREEYRSEYDCDPEDFRLIKQIKRNTELWELLDIEKDLGQEKLQALKQVVEYIN